MEKRKKRDLLTPKKNKVVEKPNKVVEKSDKVVKKPGRRTKFKAEYCEIAHQICAIFGADDVRLSKALRVAKSTLNRWKHEHLEFYESIRRGKEEYDTKQVEEALLMRALGFEREEEHAAVSQRTGEIVSKMVRRYYPPEPQCIRFWLKNRNPERWPDRYDVSLGGSMSFRDITNMEEMTPEELAKAINERLLSKKTKGKS